MDPELISSLILGTEGLALGRGIERVSEGAAGRVNSDWFTGGERVGLAGNNLRGGGSEGERVVGGIGDAERMLRGPIGLCKMVDLASIEKSLQFNVQWIRGSFSTLRLVCGSLVLDMEISCHENSVCGNGRGD